MVIQNQACPVDTPLPQLKRLIRDSYRQRLLSNASKRRQDCSGLRGPVDVQLTRSFFLPQRHPLQRQVLRHVLTGSVDNTFRLFRSGLVNFPLCPFCFMDNEISSLDIFCWECTRWKYVRNNYPILTHLFSLKGSLWPPCCTECGWIDSSVDYGFELLNPMEISYDFIMTSILH